MTDHSVLINLPTELIAEVAAQLQNRALIEFRLVCRKLKTVSQDFFIERFFRERKHVYSRYGLQTLVDITSQPHLIRKLQMIYVVDTEIKQGIATYYRKTRPRNLVPTDAIIFSPDKLRSPQTSGLPDHSRSQEGNDEVIDRNALDWESAAKADLFAHQEAWKLEVGKMKEDDLAVNLLSLVMSQLKVAGQCPGFSVTDGPGPYPHQENDAFGLNQLARTLGHHLTTADFESDGCRRATSTLLSALGRSGYSPRELRLKVEPAQPPGNYRLKRAFEVPDDLKERSMASWRALTSLVLGFHDTGQWVHASKFCHYLSAATMVEELTLYGCIDYGGSSLFTVFFFTRITHSGMGEHLRSIRVQDMGAFERTWIAMLAKFSGRLRILSLVNVAASQCWMSVLDFMKNNLTLDHLQLTHLRKAAPRADKDYAYVELRAPEGTASFEWHGETQSRDGLEQLISNGQYVEVSLR